MMSNKEKNLQRIKELREQIQFHKKCLSHCIDMLAIHLEVVGRIDGTGTPEFYEEGESENG